MSWQIGENWQETRKKSLRLKSHREARCCVSAGYAEYSYLVHNYRPSRPIFSWKKVRNDIEIQLNECKWKKWSIIQVSDIVAVHIRPRLRSCGKLLTIFLTCQKLASTFHCLLMFPLGYYSSGGHTDSAPIIKTHISDAMPCVISGLELFNEDQYG